MISIVPRVFYCAVKRGHVVRSAGTEDIHHDDLSCSSAVGCVIVDALNRAPIRISHSTTARMYVVCPMSEKLKKLTVRKTTRQL